MTRICKIDECSKKVHATELCAMHYYRLLRTGKLTARVKAKDGEAAAWLREHASHQGNECLFWPFGSPSRGYGQVRVNGIDLVASRLMCTLAHGEPPSPDHEAAHSCGNGHLGCMNPKHLRWATHADNMKDLEVHRRVRGPAAVSAICELERF